MDVWVLEARGRRGRGRAWRGALDHVAAPGARRARPGIGRACNGARRATSQWSVSCILRAVQKILRFTLQSAPPLCDADERRAADFFSCKRQQNLSHYLARNLIIVEKANLKECHIMQTRSSFARVLGGQNANQNTPAENAFYAEMFQCTADDLQFYMAFSIVTIREYKLSLAVAFSLSIECSPIFPKVTIGNKMVKRCYLKVTELGDEEMLAKWQV
uniref:Uncharacterized protein n=2 Tax=Oryza TaxID=4527 RepID=A0A0E0AX05_9ORYZ